MDRSIADTAAVVLLAVGVAGLLLPALFPAQQVLYHEVDDGTTANGSELEAQGYTVVAYENLSDRGQDIYVEALRSPERRYTVPAGEGAPEFPYTGANDSGPVENAEEYQQRRIQSSIVIERPEDADLPPAAEPVQRVDRELEERQAAAEDEPGTPKEARLEARLEQRRAETERYDLMTVQKGTPRATDSGSLSRLGGVLLGTLAIGVGGYLRSRS